jgi:hypothetical protein
MEATTSFYYFMDWFEKFLLESSSSSGHLAAARIMMISQSPDFFAHVMFVKLPESAGDVVWSI